MQDALIGSVTEAAVHLTPTQSRTQFGLWCLLSAQLIIGGNILHMSAWDLETYSNRALIAINQDSAGRQAMLVQQTCRAQNPQHVSDVPACQQVWLKALANGDYAIGFVNYTNSSAGGLHAQQDSASGQLALATCENSSAAQRWNISQPSPGGMVKIASTHRTNSSEPAPATGWCVEVNGCDYTVGSRVDTSYSCKPLPPPGNADKCAANMAWYLNANGTISASWDTSLCLEVVGGGMLSRCDGSPAQAWRVQGQPGEQQLASGSGFGCLSNGNPPGGNARAMEFDVAALGWTAATVTDLWSNKTTIEVGNRRLHAYKASLG